MQKDALKVGMKFATPAREIMIFNKMKFGEI